MKHINFEAIDCRDLQYMRASDSWVCMCHFFDLKDVDFCMRCKFSRLRFMEKNSDKKGVKTHVSSR